jgi:hypothetical protein
MRAARSWGRAARIFVTNATGALVAYLFSRSVGLPSMSDEKRHRGTAMLGTG